MSIVFPEQIIYRRHCEKHENETIIRNEVHYVSATVIFLAISIFQLVVIFKKKFKLTKRKQIILF